LKALDAFKSGEVDLLICTDVAARGLDIKDVPAVFNFDVPYNAEDYVHRIGRTGRAGASGLAISFVSATDAKLIGDIEKLIKTKVELETVEFEDGSFSRRQDSYSDSRSDSRSPREGFDARPRRNSRDSKESQERGSSSSGSSSWGHRSYEKKAAPLDPFFEKPYEPSAAPEQTPSWEATARPTTRSISANIKPKRKVAALFKAETQEST
jgi:superfamily II DNA/RNA helicase